MMKFTITCLHRAFPKSEDSEPASWPQSFSLKVGYDFGDILQKQQISNGSKPL
jgi:hypothetical protein